MSCCGPRSNDNKIQDKQSAEGYATQPVDPFLTAKSEVEGSARNQSQRSEQASLTPPTNFDTLFNDMPPSFGHAESTAVVANSSLYHSSPDQPLGSSVQQGPAPTFVHDIYVVGNDHHVYVQQVGKLTADSVWTMFCKGEVVVPLESAEDQGNRASARSSKRSVETHPQPGLYEILCDGARVTPDVNPDSTSRRMSLLPKGTIVNALEVTFCGTLLRGRIANPHGWVSLLDTNPPRGQPALAQPMQMKKVMNIAVDSDTMYGVFEDRRVYKQTLHFLTEKWVLASQSGVKAIAIDRATIWGIGDDGKLKKQIVKNMSPDTAWEPVAKPMGIAPEHLVGISCHKDTMYAVLQKNSFVYSRRTDTIHTPHPHGEHGEWSWRAGGRTMCDIAVDCFSEDAIYAVGTDGMLYKQNLSKMSIASPWTVASGRGSPSFRIISAVVSMEGKVTATFKPGRLGIRTDKDTGEIKDVSSDGQAVSLGISVGMKILLINGSSYNDRLLTSCANGDKAFKVTLSKDASHKGAKQVENMLNQWRQLHRFSKQTAGTDIKGSFTLIVRDPSAFCSSPAIRRSLQQAIVENHGNFEGITPEWVHALNIQQIEGRGNNSKEPNINVDYTIEVPATGDEVKAVSMDRQKFNHSLQEKLTKNGVSEGSNVKVAEIKQEVGCVTVGSCLPPHKLHRDDRVAQLMIEGHSQDTATRAIDLHGNVEEAQKWINGEAPSSKLASAKSSTLEKLGPVVRMGMKDNDPKANLLDSILDGRATTGLERSHDYSRF